MGKRRPSGDGMVRKREDGRWEGRIVVGHKENGDSIFRYVSAGSQKALAEKLHREMSTYRGVDLTENSRMTLGGVAGPMAGGAGGTLRAGRVPWKATAIISSTTSSPGWAASPSARSPRTMSGSCIGMSRGMAVFGRTRSMDTPCPPLLSADSTGCCTWPWTRRCGRGSSPRIPPRGLPCPKKETAPRKILNDAQLERFMEEIRKDPIWYDFFYTELTTGLRKGEICGLMWSDFDSKQGTLSRSPHHPPPERVEASPQEPPRPELESGSSPCRPAQRSCCKSGRSAPTPQWIFSHPLLPEQPLPPDMAYNRMKTLLKRAGLPELRFHDLRHTFATHALASGVDAKTLSGILGHTKASFTLDTYAHVTGDMQRQAAQVMDNFMTDIFGKELAPWQSGESPAAAAST